jgi:hypothetical protein
VLYDPDEPELDPWLVPDEEPEPALVDPLFDVPPSVQVEPPVPPWSVVAVPSTVDASTELPGRVPVLVPPVVADGDPERASVTP